MQLTVSGRAVRILALDTVTMAGPTEVPVAHIRFDDDGTELIVNVEQVKVQ